LELESSLAASVETAKSLGRNDKARLAAYHRAADLIEKLYHTMDMLEKALDDDPGKVVIALASLRDVADQLESICPDNIWPFPCYGEMFFKV
jgi:glutamine synthetase type III